MKLFLVLALFSLAIGCSGETTVESKGQVSKSPKSDLGKALNKAHQVDEAQKSRDQALKEQADSL